MFVVVITDVFFGSIPRWRVAVDISGCPGFPWVLCIEQNWNWHGTNSFAEWILQSETRLKQKKRSWTRTREEVGTYVSYVLPFPPLSSSWDNSIPIIRRASFCSCSLMLYISLFVILSSEIQFIFMTILLKKANCIFFTISYRMMKIYFFNRLCFWCTKNNIGRQLTLGFSFSIASADVSDCLWPLGTLSMVPSLCVG